MRGEIICIISEGAEDQAIIKAILKAYGFDGSEIRAIRPDLNHDATDRHNNRCTIGTLQGVKNSCIGQNGRRLDFERAFSIFGCNNIVIQLDTLELETQDFPFKKPIKRNNQNYCSELRGQIIDLIDRWLDGYYKDKLLYAISIEEMECWCLTIYENCSTVDIINSKGKLYNHLNCKGINFRKFKLDPKESGKFFEEFLRIEKFHKIAKLKNYAQKNKSLELFLDSLDQKFHSSK